MITKTTEKVCNICGGVEFNDRFRSSLYGISPQCNSCGSMERTRIIRKIYNKIPPAILKEQKALQFSNDRCVNREAFASFEVSIYGGENSLDLMAIDKPDESYDWIILNQVLEHVSDDLLAIKELLRILKPTGIIHINIPSPAYNLETKDWGYPDPEVHDHYRGYGSDFLLRIDRALTNCYAIQVVDIDNVTETLDIVYFIGKSYDVIRRIGLHLFKQKCVVLRGK